VPYLVEVAMDAGGFIYIFRGGKNYGIKKRRFLESELLTNSTGTGERVSKPLERGNFEGNRGPPFGRSALISWSRKGLKPLISEEDGGKKKKARSERDLIIHASRLQVGEETVFIFYSKGEKRDVREKLAKSCRTAGRGIGEVRKRKCILQGSLGGHRLPVSKFPD